MTHSILLIVSKPDKTKQLEHQSWEDLPTTLSELATKNKGIEILGQNVLLIRIEETLDVLVKAVSEFHKFHLGYNYLIFDEEMKVSEVVSKL